jgi:hypothetical protein
MTMTKAMTAALKWLANRGGDAAFDRNGVALAQGDTAPVTRSTWNKLRDAGLVEFYNPTGKGRGRVRVVARVDA